jgi:hypothetical protein
MGISVLKPWLMLSKRNSVNYYQSQEEDQPKEKTLKEKPNCFQEDFREVYW